MPLPFTIKDVCRLCGIPVKKERGSFEVPCPVCGGSRLNIDTDKNVFNCARCRNTGGGMKHLYALYKNVEEDDAIKLIMQELGLAGGKDTAEWKQAVAKIAAERQEIPVETPMAELWKRNKTYQAFLNLLVLAEDHMQSLLNRGLTAEEIAWLEYKTIPLSGFKLIVENLQMMGCYLKGIPGFFKMRESGSWMIFKQKRGILIPIRHLDGSIQGFQTRLDDTRNGKFRAFTSNGMNEGTSAKTWAHFAGEWKDGDREIYLTEGPMKADIFYLVTRKNIVAIPGVTCTSELMEMLLTLKERGLEHIKIALDMDFLDEETMVDEDGVITTKRKQVYYDYARLIELLTKAGFTYSRVVWPREYKGIDDYVVAKSRKAQ